VVGWERGWAAGDGNDDDEMDTLSLFFLLAGEESRLSWRWILEALLARCVGRQSKITAFLPRQSSFYPYCSAWLVDLIHVLQCSRRALSNIVGRAHEPH